MKKIIFLLIFFLTLLMNINFIRALCTCNWLLCAGDPCCEITLSGIILSNMDCCENSDCQDYCENLGYEVGDNIIGCTGSGKLLIVACECAGVDYHASNCYTWGDADCSIKCGAECEMNAGCTKYPNGKCNLDTCKCEYPELTPCSELGKNDCISRSDCTWCSKCNNNQQVIEGGVGKCVSGSCPTYSCKKDSCGAECDSDDDCDPGQTCNLEGCYCEQIPEKTCSEAGGTCKENSCSYYEDPCSSLSGSCPSNKPYCCEGTCKIPTEPEPSGCTREGEYFCSESLSSCFNQCKAGYSYYQSDCDDDGTTEYCCECRSTTTTTTPPSGDCYKCTWCEYSSACKQTKYYTTDKTGQTKACPAGCTPGADNVTCTEVASSYCGTPTTTTTLPECSPIHPEPCGGEGKLEGMYCPGEGSYSWTCQKTTGGTLSISLETTDDIDIEISDPCGHKETKKHMSESMCNKKGKWTIKLIPRAIHSPYNITSSWIVSCTSDDDCPNCYEKCDIDGSITGTPNICYDFRPLLTNTCRYYDYCENGYIPGTTTPCSPFDDYCYNAQSELCNDSNYACHAWFSC